MIDAHCHLHEYSDEEILEIERLGLTIIAVSDDIPSSIRTLELSQRFKWVIPAIGIHPWEISAETVNDIEKLEELVENHRNVVRILGEVGLDKRFRKETYSYQLEAFRRIVDLAQKYDLALNLHCVDAWREVLEIVHRAGIRIAIFHWYTGPVELLNEIRDYGYFISINPAISMQEKHRKIVECAPLEVLLVESDAPYKYRGMELHPRMIFDTLRIIADIKKLSLEQIVEVIEENAQRLLKELGLSLR